jgi:parvulin-like peptidyl-prolyl isomerase
MTTAVFNYKWLLMLRPMKGKIMKRYCFKHLSLACLAVLVVGCNQVAEPQSKPPEVTGPVQTDAGAAGPNIPVGEPKATEVAVTVDGVDITESQLKARIKSHLEKVADKIAELPPEAAERYKEQLRQKILERMIMERLLDEEVRAAKIVVTEDDVISHIEEGGARQQPPVSLEQIKARIEARGQSFDEVKRQIRNSQAMRYQKLMKTKWAGKINVTEDDAKEYYSENKEQFETPEQVKVSYIFVGVNTEDPNFDPNESWAKAKAKAEELLEQSEYKTHFAELAGANSPDTSIVVHFDDLGYLPRGKLVEPLAEVAFGLDLGQVSDLIETQFGYYTIKVTGRKASVVTTFEQAKHDIINKLTKQKRVEFSRQYIDSLKSKADIVYPPGKEPDEDTVTLWPKRLP